MASTDTHSTTIPRRTGVGPRPLSFPQERLFLLDRILPGLPAYNVPTLVRVHGTLDAELLRRACELVVERHEILRTSIRLIDGVPAQEVAPNRPFELTVADLRSHPAEQRARRRRTGSSVSSSGAHSTSRATSCCASRSCTSATARTAC